MLLVCMMRGALRATYHQVDKVKHLGELSQRHVLVVFFSGWCGDGERKVWPRAVGALARKLVGIGIHACSDRLEKLQKLLALFRVLGILPVDVDAVEAQVLDQLDAAVGERLAALRCRSRGVEVLLLVGICPATNRKKDFQVAVLLLEKIELLQIPVEVVALVVPRVALVVDLDVGPFVRKEDFTIGTIVAEGVEDVGQFVCGDCLGKVLSPVDTLRRVRMPSSYSHLLELTQLTK